jgi:hypothetical protein
MAKRPRIPGSSGKRTLYVLPEIPDDYPVELKNAIAIRNACATEGKCPGCGAVGELHEDEQHAGLFHWVFQHEPWCGALTDEAA